ncbi:hypothetical protein F4604DRAFT_1126365 [Suillus subluteus]|nr:hypothetical protein F4604DRAFT_1126365 [Suillus subluteus]
MGRNKLKLDRNKRALVRALAKRCKWDHKEIAAVFRVSLPLIKRTVANNYTTVIDIVSEDANFYKQSDLEELVLGRLPPAPEKKRKRKTQKQTYARSSNKSVQEVLCRQACCRFSFCINFYGGRTGFEYSVQHIRDVPRRSNTCSRGKGPFHP